MIPLRDANPTRSTPIVTVILIGLNLLAWLLELSQEWSQSLNAFVIQWAIVPSQLLASPISEAPTLLTSMFLHGGWGHLLGNMLYLWIFGDNIEDRLGRRRFVLFYITCGLVASFVQIAVDPSSNVPQLGASGAIAGVMGGYILLFPRARVETLVGYYSVRLPAIIVLGFWFVIQFFGGFDSLSSVEASQGGVAFFAHIGGFAAGLLLIKLFQIGRPVPYAADEASDRWHY